jgi:hypothetical protein
MASPEQRIILGWYNRAQIDYSDYFLRLYIAYNAWYKKVTGQENDFEAIALLKQRFVIWDDYLKGETLAPLRPIVKKIVVLTHVRSLTTDRNTFNCWSGRVDDENDWKGLISFWYSIRCKIIHGSWLPAHSFEMVLVQLAYESLNMFMTEIIARMNCAIDDEDAQFYPQSYILAPSLWEVDMASVRKE